MAKARIGGSVDAATLRSIFESKYNRENWIGVLRDIFNVKNIYAEPKYTGIENKEWGARVLELGNFETDKGQMIGIYEVPVNKSIRLERKKVGLRDLLRPIYKHKVDAAFIVFDQGGKWRFTYVSEIGNKKNRKITDPKRYTYILGEGERCKTAALQFARIQTEETLFGKAVRLDAIEAAFNVDKLSDDFFNGYKRLYGKFTVYLTGKDENNKQIGDAHPILRSFFNGEEKAARDFVKKMMGRIVFLYFLEKKGWLGVPEDKPWGEGDEDFLSKLFKDCNQKANFYQQVLVPLFFETLNRERTDNRFQVQSQIFDKGNYNKLKVPFLNGGLFDNQEPNTNNLVLPEELFAELFKFFDQYNFTVYEDSPDEHTVAVDPEMLGHIFENLLEDNKDNGVYYTRKEIVHYMCQESLIEYLHTRLNPQRESITRESLEGLIKNNEIKGLTSNVEALLIALRDVKICDPAIGSGAFPMGMLHEIFYAVEQLYEFSPDVAENVWGVSAEKWEPAKVKQSIIQNSIYGVDIEQGAVDIARLRFWLSLVVDEDMPQPLPNLDYKIVVGNSLVSKFDGQAIEIDWRLTIKGAITDEVKKIQKQQQAVHTKLKSLFEKQKNYFDYDGDKNILKEEIRKLKIDVLTEQIQLNIERNNLYSKQVSLFDESSKGRKKAVTSLTMKMALDKTILTLNRLKLKSAAPINYFDWKLDFPEIMNEDVTQTEVGFDIIIGNPPYVKEYTNREAFAGIPYYQGKMDIWYAFACQGIDPLLKTKGLLTFIATNNWVTNAGASIMREKVLNDTQIMKMIDFGGYMIFDSASIQTMIMMFKKQSDMNNYDFDYRKLIGKKMNFEDVVDLLYHSETNNTVFLTPTIDKEKYRDKFFVFGEASIEDILEKIRSKQNFTLDSKEEVACGIDVHQDFVNKKGAQALGDLSLKGTGIFNITTAEKKALDLTPEEKALVKRFYTTDELSKYYGDRTNKMWVIYTDSSFKNRSQMKPYPNLKKHLDRFVNIITSDNAPYGLHRSRAEYFFKGEKIISLRKCELPTFTYTDFDCYVSQTFYVIKTKRTDVKYLTGLLNSKLIAFWLRHKGKMQGGQFQVDKEPLLDIPIHVPEKPSIIASLVDKILAAKVESKASIRFEEKIDVIIYRMYELAYEEASIIEGNEDWMSKEEYDKYKIG